MLTCLLSHVLFKMAAYLFADCGDFLQFQDLLKRMRVLDDKIIYALNTNLPTESFSAETNCRDACQNLFGELTRNYQDRENAIENCISQAKSKIEKLKSKREQSHDDVSILKELRKEQNKLRLLQTELGVEEIIKERTNKVFYERCRSFYLPPNFNVS